MSAQPGSAARLHEVEDDRTGLTKEALRRAFLDNLYYVQGKFPALATKHDYYMALAYTVRDRLLRRWISTASTYTREGSRTVAYLSAEFLLGPHLVNNVINLGIEKPVRDAIRDWDSASRNWWGRSRSRAWATADWAGLRPATWIPWRPWKYLRSGTASATNSESSPSPWSTAGRWSRRTSGCATATRGNCLARSGPWK
jgi:hypothetical protein